MSISVITPTYQRPRFLANCLDQFSRQVKNIAAEHIVVSDGPDSLAKRLCELYGASYFELPTHKGKTGSYARDLGIEKATGDYVVFWDDDNTIFPNALASAYATANGYDVGVTSITHIEPEETFQLPIGWTGQPVLGRIDTLCVCVRRSVAQQVKWVGDKDIEVDYDWIKRVFDLGITSNYSTDVIGLHVGYNRFKNFYE